MTLDTTTTEETEAVGERLGRALEPGDFLGLRGDLGAGKTAFVRGLSRGLSLPPEAGVSSPTFAIVNTYEGGRLPLFHADLYRVRDAEELYDAGYYDLLESPGAFAVEWIDHVPGAAPDDWLELVLRRTPTGRSLSFEPHGPRARTLLARFDAAKK